jgi:hypothetical protein
MTGPIPPRHLDAPPLDIPPRQPKRREVDTPRFPALLAEDAPTEGNALRAISFEGSGVFGRPPAAPQAETRAARSCGIDVDATLAAPAPSSPSEAVRPLASGDKHRPTSISVGALSVINDEHTATATLREHEQASSVFAPPAASATRTPRRISPASTESCASNAAPRAAPRRNASNTIFVAIHAVEQGCIVYARAGRMSATERENLRQSVRALLAEHGLTADSICIDGESAVAGVGGDLWLR